MGQNALRISFLKELDKLNLAQRRAVETTQGPVLVVAGPGTGKTQILAARIGYILSKPELQATPYEILCLTYTEAGVTAMRERLIKFIGPDAHKVPIHTFHSFCNLVIQDNPSYFGLHELEPISKLETREILREIIDGLPTGHILKRQSGAPYYDEVRMASLFTVMKKENWDARYISKKADEYIASLYTNPAFIYDNKSGENKKGDLKIGKINEQKQKMQRLKAAAALFDTYQQKMQARGRYDYEDMILWVLRAFKAHPHLLLQYQEQFHYLLVDEYQDTNNSQNELLQLICRFWEQPNVFAVGDDDQSIYRFQGANLKNILDFTDMCGPATKTIVLTDNYRSSQTILNAAHNLINNNTERLSKKLEGLSKELWAKNDTYSKITTLPELWEYANPLQESIGLAQEIERMAHAGVDLSKVAVLYRSHRDAEDIIRYLRAKNIPVNQKKRLDILQEPLIKNFITLLRFLHAETNAPNSGEALLFQILHFDFLNLPPQAIAKLAAESTTHDTDKGFISWRDLLLYAAQHDWKHLFKPDEAVVQRMVQLGELFERWITAVHNTTLPGLLEQILTESGMLVHMLKQPHNKWHLEVLHTFFSFVKEECQRKGDICLSDLVSTIELMQDSEIDIPIEKVLCEDGGVNFGTAHAAKGLEFEYVFLMGCSKSNWQVDKSKRFNYPMPDTLVQSNTGDELEEGRRLFFVALTRAKKQLVVSYPAADNKGKQLVTCSYVSELEASGFVKHVQITLNEIDLLEYHLARYNQLDEKTSIELLEKESLDMLLKDYSLSATHFNKYLRCPISFYYEDVLRVPMAKNEHACFGTAVHDALQRQLEYIRETGSEPNKEVLLHDFERSMKRQRAYFSSTQYDRKLAFGKYCLQAYFDHHSSTWDANSFTEKKLKQVVWNGVPLNGKIDVLIPVDGHYNVVDYKTGDPGNADKKIKGPSKPKDPAKPTFENLYGGDLWRQAIFYKILIDNETSGRFKFNSFFFDFVQPNEQGELLKKKVVVTPEKETFVKNLIQSVYAKIKSHEFSEGCGDAQCKWCSFTRDHKFVKQVNFQEGNKDLDLNQSLYPV
ncbi:ATP-dependent helicase [Pontibacter sp. MBLB2868]|uniref:ATP-dependent helicase n=1 Tax=Pontibacter sp. MBLB2868 TaxID=3451555 RepID=UPI003F75698F